MFIVVHFKLIFLYSYRDVNDFPPGYFAAFGTFGELFVHFIDVLA